MNIPNELILIMGAYSRSPEETLAIVEQLTPPENRTAQFQKTILIPLKREFIESLNSMIQAANLSLQERLDFQMSMIRPVFQINLANFSQTKSELISRLFALTKKPHNTFMQLRLSFCFKEAFDFVNTPNYEGRRDGAHVLNSGTDTRTLIMDLIQLNRINDAIELTEKSIDLQHHTRVIEPLIKYLCTTNKSDQALELIGRITELSGKDQLLICISSTLTYKKDFVAAYKACKKIKNLEYRDSQLLTLCDQLIKSKQINRANQVAEEIKNAYKKHLAFTCIARVSNNQQGDRPLDPPPA